jgi:hypothetical protein
MNRLEFIVSALLALVWSDLCAKEPGHAEPAPRFSRQVTGAAPFCGTARNTARSIRAPSNPARQPDLAMKGKRDSYLAFNSTHNVAPRGFPVAGEAEIAVWIIPAPSESPTGGRVACLM